MAVDASAVRANYVGNLQAVAKLVLELNENLINLNNLYLGAGLSGTFVDAEMLTNANTKHMSAADIGTFTANLNTVQAAMSSGIVQNMSKAVGKSI